MLGLTELIPPLLEGLTITVRITVMPAGVALVMAFLAGLMSLSRLAAVRWTARVYIEFFRGTSALVQLFWIYYALPLFGFRFDAITAGVIALGLNIGSYGAEVVRGAINAVPRNQWEAATAIDLSRWQAMRLVVVPQALVAMLPPFGNLWIELLKATALVSLITIHDLTFKAQMLRTATMQTTEIYGLVLLMYFAVALVIIGIMRTIERYAGRGLDRKGAR